jgi:hypothetical protein
MSPPSFTSPEAVTSPKGQVSDLRILFNTGGGGDGWSLASLRWNGRNALGIRWNGDEQNPIGNPQSRGIPTWFIVPDAIAAVLQERYGQSLMGLTEPSSEIARVRLRPLPRRIWRGEEQEQVDDEWVRTVVDRTQRAVEISNPRTGHFLLLHPSHVKALIPDSPRDPPEGLKHGLLELNVQVVFDDAQMRLEPLPSLTDRIDEMFAELWVDGYQAKHEKIRELIHHCRVSLTAPDGTLGKWEEEELAYAEGAIRTNFLRLALTAVKKAIAVNKLTPEEYEYGFNYSKPKSRTETQRRPGAG